MIIGNWKQSTIIDDEGTFIITTSVGQHVDEITIIVDDGENR
jgi:hypothetical protein